MDDRARAVEVRAAYNGAASGWAAGPERVFGPLADSLLAAGPDWHGRLVLDVGSGAGAVARSLISAGATVVALDVAEQMLIEVRSLTQHVLVADARSLPLVDGCLDAVVLAFVLNHLDEPDRALREAARVVRPGGYVLASTWAREDDHPAREVVERGLARHGFVRPAWYVALKERTIPLTDTVDGLCAAAAQAGLTADVSSMELTLDLAPEDLVAWRLSMAHHVGLVAALPAQQRRDLLAELTAACVDQPPLRCRTLRLVATT